MFTLFLNAPLLKRTLPGHGPAPATFYLNEFKRERGGIKYKTCKPPAIQ